MNDIQTILLVFYAIFWGYIANVQPHWKAFHFPLIFKVRQALNRTILSVLVFNVLPLILFPYLMSALAGSAWNGITSAMANCHYVICGVIPAFAVFGLYRCWL